jgi:hypothetical protein
MVSSTWKESAQSTPSWQCESILSFTSKKLLLMPCFQGDIDINVVTKPNSPTTIALLQASIISMIPAVPRPDAREINWFYDTAPVRIICYAGNKLTGIRRRQIAEDVVMLVSCALHIKLPPPVLLPLSPPTCCVRYSQT